MGHPRLKVIDSYSEARTHLSPTRVRVLCVCLTPARRASLDEEGDLYVIGTPGDAVAFRLRAWAIRDMCNVQLRAS